MAREMRNKLFIVTAVVALGSTVDGGTISEREVTSSALQQNPMLQAAKARWEMMKARVPQAQAWEDLRAGGDFRVERSVNIPPNSFMDQTVMLEQEFPVSGKNLSRGRVATAEAWAAFEDSRRAELDVILRVRSAYARWANAYAQLEVNRRNSDLVEQIAQISRSRYEAGSATQPEALTAQTEAARLLETRADLERQISEAESALNVLMNRPAQQALGEPVPLAMHEKNLSLQNLQGLALAQRPEMQRAQYRVAIEKSRLELAKRQWFPDPAVNVKAQRYNDAAEAISEVDLCVSFPIPFANWKKHNAGVLEARKSVETAEREFDATRVETLGLVRDQLKKVQTSSAQYYLYDKRILPLARQTVEASRSAYEANTGGFLELVTARRTLQDAEAAALNHLADYETALAELDAIVGRQTVTVTGGEK